jgi:hypothetical protein
LQNTPGGTTDFSGSANVSFANADGSQVDECITVTDDQLGALGTVCANESPKTFTYSLTVVRMLRAEYTYVNTAASPPMTQARQVATATLNVNVPALAAAR